MRAISLALAATLTLTAVAPALARTVRHCLETSPDQRFPSARDLAFDLGSFSALTPVLTGPVIVPDQTFKVG